MDEARAAVLSEGPDGIDRRRRRGVVRSSSNPAAVVDDVDVRRLHSDPSMSSMLERKRSSADPTTGINLFEGRDPPPSAPRSTDVTGQVCSAAASDADSKKGSYTILVRALTGNDGDCDDNVDDEDDDDATTYDVDGRDESLIDARRNIDEMFHTMDLHVIGPIPAGENSVRRNTIWSVSVFK